MLTDYYQSHMDVANSGSTHVKTLANIANRSRRIVQVWPTKNSSGWFLTNATHGNVKKVHGPTTEPETITTPAVRSISREFSGPSSNVVSEPRAVATGSYAQLSQNLYFVSFCLIRSLPLAVLTRLAHD